MIRHLNAEAQREADFKAKNGDPELLAEFRKKPCEVCGKPGPSDPHHVFSKGAGLAEIRENLVSLCRACHSGYHYSSKPSLEDLLTVVALREGIIATDVFPEVCRIRMLPKPQEGRSDARQDVPMPKRASKPSKAFQEATERRRAYQKKLRADMKSKQPKRRNPGMS